MKKSVVRIFAISIVLAMLLSCVFALCACNEKDDSKFENDTRFGVDYDNIDIMGMNKFLVKAVKGAAIDDKNTYFEFKKDGTMHMQIQTKKGLFGSIPQLLKTLESANIKIDIASALETFDVKGSVDKYVEPMFPGFTQKLKEYDLKGALGLIQHSLGFNIDGLDLANEKVKAAVKYVGDNMALPADLLEAIPSDTVLRLTLDTQYAIRNLTASDGTQFRAIYLGYKVKDNPQTAPFGVFTLTENDTVGRLSIEFMNIHIAIKQH